MAPDRMVAVTIRTLGTRTRRCTTAGGTGSGPHTSRSNLTPGSSPAGSVPSPAVSIQKTPRSLSLSTTPSLPWCWVVPQTAPGNAGVELVDAGIRRSPIRSRCAALRCRAGSPRKISLSTTTTPRLPARHPTRRITAGEAMNFKSGCDGVPCQRSIHDQRWSTPRSMKPKRASRRPPSGGDPRVQESRVFVCRPAHGGTVSRVTHPREPKSSVPQSQQERPFVAPPCRCAETCGGSSD